ncbi:NAD(P)-dependent oxidoreductase [Gammaproteobacteria bacterium]|jgi:3-hydroxyisobutyrate dehydrogenase-like beta-hydroxyacid dehydrogenase|nr:NAD(P)-dependent oxidoreductase [Gammaproteobacteria bacterium]
MNKIGFIGLGVMGYRMAGHLSNEFSDICIFNRSQGKVAKWLSQYSGKAFDSPEELSSQCNVIALCVGRDADVREMMAGKKGILNSVNPGTIIIDHTTTSATLSKEMNELALQKGVIFLDAPISGGQSGAESGQLSVMVGGDEASYQSIKPILDTYSKFTKYMGPSGSGQLTKMVNQICIAGLVQALSEGVNFSEKVGLNTSDVMEVITKGAAQSWQMENRWETMLRDEYDHGFAVDWMRKDLDIVSEQAGKVGANIEITEMVNKFYKDIQDLDGGRWDTSSLLKRIKDSS